jgi:hypothetical protein
MRWHVLGMESGGLTMKQTLYWLDQKVLDLPFTQDRVVPMTLGEIYKSLGDRRFEVEDRTVDTQVITETEKLVFKGPAFNLQMLTELLRLRNEGATLLLRCGSGTTRIEARTQNGIAFLSYTTTRLSEKRFRSWIIQAVDSTR